MKVYVDISKVGPVVPNDGASTMFRPRLILSLGVLMCHVSLARHNYNYGSQHCQPSALAYQQNENFTFIRPKSSETLQGLKFTLLFHQTIFWV